ncbi:replication initiation protein [Sulfuricurvum sp.]|uniref:replication initiation protein n=1 Tax=Sulfuricurvum sp. TaxID=2025608 RepID=UPI0026284F87|nr:replication initiation protein [Sulfuricurvum sp.]MDD3597103.1 replication initiation protein [Sulfuricurvum sp.]
MTQKTDKTAILDPTHQKNEMVVMHNHLIRGSYKYSLVEFRFILSVASMIKADDTEFVTYQLGAKDFAEMIDSKHKDEYKRIKDLGIALMSKPIILENQKESEFSISSWFKKFSYKKGTIYCSFHDDLKPYLLQLRGHFTKVSLENFLKMKSRYAMLLYWVAKSWETRGYFEMSVEDFKDLLGVKTKAYDRYNNLKNKVIDVAVNEINRLTTMKIEFEEIKDGRKVEKLRFKILRGDGVLGAKPDYQGVGSTEDDHHNYFEDAKEIVDLFISFKKQIQPNFDIYKASAKKDPYDVMSKHLAEGVRKKESYIDMIKWLFNTNGAAKFWRLNIHAMDGLITHFDKVELAYIEEKNDPELKAKITAKVNIMKSQNATEDEIKEEIDRIVKDHHKKVQPSLF